MKLFNATKKIAAVGAASVIVANAAFAAGLNNYPNNFVEDGKFVGNVVVGSSATADAAAAEALIADLTADLGGDEKVKITYRKSSTSGKELPAVKSSRDVNFNEALSLSLENSLSDSDSDLLEDGQLDKEDYEQEFSLEEVSANFVRKYDSKLSDDMVTGLLFEKGATFAKYSLTFDDNVDVSEGKTFTGEKLAIMGQDFVVQKFTDSELVLVGGSNKVSLGENEKTTVTVEGKSYEVEVQSVSDKKVLLSVNGQSKSIDVTDSEEVAGVTVVVTELVSSSRDSVKGYAEIVIGGQEITIKKSGEVEIDDEKVSKINDKYKIVSTMTGSGTDKVKTISLVYKVDEKTLLEEGDSLEDVLFNAFNLNFDELVNDGKDDKSTFKVTSNNMEAGLEGVTSKGTELDISDLIKTDGANVKLIGDDDNDAFLIQTAATAGTDVYDTNAVATMIAIDDLNSGDLFSVGTATLAATEKTLKANTAYYKLSFTDASEGIRFIVNDDDHPVMYEITSVDSDEMVVEKLTEDNKEVTIREAKDFASKVELSNSNVVVANGVIYVEANSLGKTLRFENDLLVDLSDVNNVHADSKVKFTYHGDFDADEATEAQESFFVKLGYDTPDTQFKFAAGAADSPSWDSENFADGQFRLSKNSDVRMATSRYGTTVEIDTDSEEEVIVMVPSKEVKAEVSYSTGAVASSTSSAIVDAADVADKKAELEKEGYKIVGTEDVSAVEVEVTAPMTDAEVTEMSNLIVVGGPAVNAVARTLLGVEEYSMEAAGVVAGEAVAKYFADSNSVLVYGYEAADTAAIVEKLVAGEADFE